MEKIKLSDHCIREATINSSAKHYILHISSKMTQYIFLSKRIPVNVLPIPTIICQMKGKKLKAFSKW